MDRVEATLQLSHGISKAGNSYEYVSVVVDNKEVTRLFMRPLEIQALFPNRLSGI